MFRLDFLIVFEQRLVAAAAGIRCLAEGWIGPCTTQGRAVPPCLCFLGVLGRSKDVLRKLEENIMSLLCRSVFT